MNEAGFVSDRNGDVFITLVAGDSLIFYRISSDGTSCTVSELPYKYCKEWDNCGMEIRSDENGKYYYNGVYGLANFTID